MNRARLGILLAFLAGVAVLMLAPKPRRLAPDLLRSADEQGVPSRSDAESMSLRGARATDVFTPRNEVTQLKDGPVRWPSLLFWCKTFAAHDDDRFLLTDVRVATNRRPTTPEDLDSMVRIPLEAAPSRIGDLIGEAIGKQTSGLVATEATLEGGRDLDSARIVHLDKGFTITLVDPGPPARKALLTAESLSVELEKGQPVRGFTNSRVRLESAEGTMEGTGLEFTVASGVLIIHKDVEGTLNDLSLIGRRGPPATFRAGGPLVWTPGGDPLPGPDQTAPVRDLRLDFGGGVSVSQGGYSVRGGRLTIDAYKAGKDVVSFEVEEKVSAQTPHGTFDGNRILFVRGDQPGEATITLSGTPVQANLLDAARALPGLGARGDLSLITDGLIVFEAVDAPDDAPRPVRIGPHVVLTTPEARVDADDLLLVLEKVPANRAGRAPGDKETYPARIEFDGKVRGRGPAGSFACARLVYTRSFDADGLPHEDRIELNTRPELVYLLGGKPIAEGTAPLTSRDLWGAPGPLQIHAAHSLTLTLDPLGVRPMVAEAHGDVQVRRSASGPEDRVQGHLDAEHVTLTLEQQWDADLEQAGAIRFLSSVQAVRARAEGAVMLRIPDRFQGDGDLLTYDATTGEVIIAREAPKAVATAVFKDGKQREQALSAPAIVYRAANRSLEATGGAKAHVSIPLIAYGRKRDETPVPSDVFADQLTVWLTDPDTIGSSGTRVQEVLAEGHVHLTQPGGSGLVATHLRLDITKDETLIRGVPARLDITRHAEDRTFSEWVIATEITLSGSEVFLRGPVEARLHARPADLVMSLPGQRTPAPPENQGLTPVDITAAADLYLSEERILGRGGVVVVQGRPPLDGFRLAGDKVMLFLVPEAPLANAGLRARLRNLRVVRAVVEGSIQFKSADMDAQGDVLRLDRDEKIVSLYSHEGNAVLTFRGSYQGARPRFDLDLSDPENPRVISTLEPPDRAPR